MKIKQRISTAYPHSLTLLPQTNVIESTGMKTPAAQKSSVYFLNNISIGI